MEERRARALTAMRVCYFLQTHRNPAQIHRLVRVIRRGSPHSLIVIGHDSTSGALDLDPIASLGGLTLLASQAPVRRGWVSSLQPYLDAIEWLWATGADFEWLVYLSGQDYPARPVAEFEEVLTAGNIDGWLPAWDIFASTGPWGRSKRGHRRYYFQYREPPRWTHAVWRAIRRPVNNVQSLLHIHTTYGVRVGLRAVSPPFAAAFRCYAGPHRHALSRTCVSYLRDTLRARPELLAYYHRTMVPEESLVQTVLLNHGRFRLKTTAMHYADTEGRRDGGARVLTEADLPGIVASRCFFARKFDASQDPRILDLLDARL
jgi:hypothetical protein